MTTRRHIFTCWLLGALACLCSCVPGSEPIGVGSLSLDCPLGLLSESVSHAALRARISDALSEAPMFFGPAQKPRLSHPARLHLSLVPPLVAELPLEVGVRLTLHEDPGSGREAAAQSRLILLRPSSASLLDALAEALPKSLDQLAVHWKQHTATSDALLRDLSASDSWRREGAARALGRRDLPHVIEKLVGHLHREPDLSCQMALIAALVAQRAQVAVPEIIEAMQRKEANFVAPLTYALAALGGRMAEGYLVNLAAGHVSRSVRESAREALGFLVDAETGKTNAAERG